ncbi:MAG: nicotinate-nucleotide adenylyltransferase [Clostridia bacterium]
MKIGIFGGTFDPVHNGHIRMAREALREFSLDIMILMPSFDPPHKDDKGITPYGKRVEMLVTAVADEENILVSTMEGAREGVSYTVETLRQMGKEYPGAKLYFIIGGDTLHELESWREFREVFTLAVFIAFQRKGIESQAGEEIKRLKETYNADIQLSGRAIPGLSATEIRRLAADGKSISGMVPPAVERYIIDNRLYRL